MFPQFLPRSFRPLFDAPNDRGAAPPRRVSTSEILRTAEIPKAGNKGGDGAATAEPVPPSDGRTPEGEMQDGADPQPSSEGTNEPDPATTGEGERGEGAKPAATDEDTSSEGAVGGESEGEGDTPLKGEEGYAYRGKYSAYATDDERDAAMEKKDELLIQRAEQIAQAQAEHEKELAKERAVRAQYEKLISQEKLRGAIVEGLTEEMVGDFLPEEQRDEILSMTLEERSDDPEVQRLYDQALTLARHEANKKYDEEYGKAGENAEQSVEEKRKAQKEKEQATADFLSDGLSKRFSDPVYKSPEVQAELAKQLSSPIKEGVDLTPLDVVYDIRLHFGEKEADFVLDLIHDRFSKGQRRKAGKVLDTAEPQKPKPPATTTQPKAERVKTNELVATARR